uniref:Reverse transcriptase Ty1/copia-type domain-containing protein n=1 Tax=Amphimedon queenslandica TaxID=400682 RepID=A0A1X7U8T0_AMPQE
MSMKHSKEWREAAEAEYASLMENNAWELVKLPERKKAISCQNSVSLSQNQYLVKLLEKYGLSEANTVATPMDYNVKLVKNDGKAHIKAVKRIFRYIKGTINLSLNYKGNDKPMFGYSDADWASDSDDRYSTSGNTFTLLQVLPMVVG